MTGSKHGSRTSLDAPQATGFSLLIYPFLHVIGPSGMDADLQPGPPGATMIRLLAAQGRWSPWMQRLASADDDSLRLMTDAIDDSYFLLPHVRGLLYPDLLVYEAQHSAARRSSAALAEAFKKRLSDPGCHLTDGWHGPHRAAPVHAAGSRPTDGPSVRSAAMRLTLQAPELSKLDGLAVGVDRGPNGLDWLPIEVTWADVVLFPQSVGMLVLRIEHQIDWDHLTIVRFSEAVRKVWSPTATMPMPPLRLAGHDQTWLRILEWALAPFVESTDPNPLSTEGAPQGPGRSTRSRLLAAMSPAEVTDDLLGYTISDYAQVTATNFQFIHYCYGETSRDREHGRPVSAGLAGAAAHGRVAALAELVIGHPLSDPDWRLSAAKLNEIRSINLFDYWDNWSALCWWGNIAIVAEPSGFSRGVLASNWDGDYLNALLLVNFQRLRLMRFLEELDQSGGDLATRFSRARHLADQVREFHNDFWFQEITYTPLGSRLYRHLQDTSGVVELSEAVQSEMRLVHDHWTREAAARIQDGQDIIEETNYSLQRTIAILAVFAPLVSFVFGLVGASVRWSWIDRKPLWAVAVGAAAVIVAIGAALVKTLMWVLDRGVSSRLSERHRLADRPMNAENG